jgi:hypothetical protein
MAAIPPVAGLPPAPPDAPPAPNPVLGLLEVVGFTVLAERETLVAEVFPDLRTISTYDERDLKDIAKEFRSRTAAAGRIIIPRVRVQRTFGMIHWVQDAYRCDQDPVPADFNDLEIATANRRAVIREALLEQSETVAKSAQPKKLKGEKDWYEWYDSLKNYLSLLMGTNGVPLNYVVRENEVAPLGVTLNNYEEECHALAPLTGDYFEADARRVHQIIKTYTQGESAEEWIRILSRFQDGRKDILALKAHFQGEGNASRRIAEADNMRENLHYKSERAFRFQAFLDKLQSMFTIYKEEGEEFTEEAKVRSLLDKTRHRDLQATINAVRLDQQANGASFTRAADFIAGEVSRLPEAQNLNSSRRNTSQYQVQNGAGRGRGRGNNGGRGRGRGANHGGRGRGGRGGRGGRSGRGGRITTGNARWRDDWYDLSETERANIRSERNRQGVGPGANTGGDNTGGSASISVAEVRRIISDASTTTRAADSTTDDTSALTAGTSFGGRNEARGARATGRGGT